MLTCLTAVKAITIPSGTAFETGSVGGSGITNLKTDKNLKNKFIEFFKL